MIGTGEHHYVDFGNLADAVNDLLRPRLEKLGESEAVQIRYDIGIRCPTFNKVPEGHHSPPGDPPYLETGKLQFSVRHRIVTEPSGLDVLELRAQRTSDSGDPNVAQYLENGTEKMAARPFMARSLARLTTSSTDALSSP